MTCLPVPGTRRRQERLCTVRMLILHTCKYDKYVSTLCTTSSQSNPHVTS